MAELIRFDNVSRFYAEKQALVHVNCSINKGELLYLTGHSGAGKSTFLNLLSLQDQPCEGLIFLNNHNIAQLSDHGKEAYRRKIGFVHQTPRFIKDFTIAENVALPLRLRGYSYYQAQKRVKMALYKVGLLARAEEFFYQLSGGEKQRAEIARAIVHGPVLLLADEPTGNLDYDLGHEILDIFYELNEKGTTVIIATHDRGLLSQTKERIFTLKNGLLEEMNAAAYCEKVES